MGALDFPISLISIATFVGCAAMTAVVTFGVRKLADQHAVLALPSGRRRHATPTPLLGGLGFAPVLVLGCALAYINGVNSTLVLAYFIGAGLVLTMGVADDVFELRATPKLVAQWMAAIAVVSFHPALQATFSAYGISPYLGYPLATLWIVGATNSLNLIDGLDGLCSGVAALSAVAISLICPSGSLAAFMAPSIAGAASGFLFHNFSPAKIFLGDSGSLFIGFTLATLSLDVPFSGPLFLSIGIWGFIFGFPILDTFLAIARRARQGRPLLSGDRSHLHHRLLHMGLSERYAFWVLLAMQAYSCAAAVLLSSALPDGGWPIAILAIPMIYVFMRWLSHTEYLLSFQSARLSFLFLSEELDRLADTLRLRQYIQEQAARYEADGTGFSVVMMDMSPYLKQIVALNPSRLVKFHLGLYGTLKARLRETDLIARPNELQFTVILSGAWETQGRHSPVFDFLRAELIRVQDEYGIYRSKPTEPEGFRILLYPQDRVRIWAALGIDKSREERPAQAA